MLAAVGGAFAAVALSGSAGADPIQYRSGNLVGVGSDTIQDIDNAFAGYSGGIAYTPLVTSAGNQLLSFDAVGSACITSRLGGKSFDRPNGSGAGVTALSRSIDGAATYGTATCTGPKSIPGAIDYARSSGGPSAAGTALTYIPFARDGVSFGYYRTDGGPVTTLSRDDLHTLFTSGRTTIGGISVLPCDLNPASGTRKFFLGAIGVADPTAGTAECTALAPGTIIEENDGPGLKTRGDLADAAVNGTEVVVPFSAGSFIAKSNGVASPNPGPGVGIGSISDDGAGHNLGSPISGVAPHLAPVDTFFYNAVFGRYVYHVVQSSRINAAVGQVDLKGMFKGTTSLVCQQASTIGTFGFLTLDSTRTLSDGTAVKDCGDLSITGAASP
jgi:hypothetical protein